MPTRHPTNRSHQARSPRNRGSCLVGIFLLGMIIVGLGAFLVVQGYLPALEVSRYALPSPQPYEQGSLATFFSPSVRYWGWQIESWARERDINPNLVATVMQIESCGDPEARSDAGAAGLYQVMPFHFEAGEDILEPQVNARRGLDYLRTVLTYTNGDIGLALAGYNGGLSILEVPEEAWPEETQRFTAWGEGIYRDAQAGLSKSASLADWLSHGGSRLCRRAEQRLGISPLSGWLFW